MPPTFFWDTRSVPPLLQAVSAQIPLEQSRLLLLKQVISLRGVAAGNEGGSSISKLPPLFPVTETTGSGSNGQVLLFATPTVMLQKKQPVLPKHSRSYYGDINMSLQLLLEQPCVCGRVVSGVRPKVGQTPVMPLLKTSWFVKPQFSMTPDIGNCDCTTA